MLTGLARCRAVDTDTFVAVMRQFSVAVADEVPVLAMLQDILNSALSLSGNCGVAESLPC